MSERIGADLAGEVELDRRVDRGDSRVAANHRRVVRLVTAVEGNQRVVVDEVEHARRAANERGHHLSGMNRLEAIGHDTFPDQVDQTVGEELRVHAKVVLVRQSCDQGVHDAADAELQRGTVVDEGGDLRADGGGHRGRRVRVIAMKRPVGDGVGGNALERHHGVAGGTRHLPVDFGEDQRCRIDGGPCGVDRRAEGAVAVDIRRRELHDRDVERDRPAPEQPGDVGEEDRDVVRAPVGDGRATSGPVKRDTDRMRPACEGSTIASGPSRWR